MNVKNAKDWRSFADVTVPSLKCVEPVHPDTPVSESGFSGIGFIFSSSNNYTGIDIDPPAEGPTEAQTNVYKRFNSYTEWSPSGKGIHIIVKGKLPSGKRKDGIEVYSDSRFFAMTGSVVNPTPIAERQDYLNILFDQMGGDKPDFDASPHFKAEAETDDIILQRMFSAENGLKAEAYYTGNLLEQESTSEAALGLMNIIGFYTQNRDQMVRLFRKSSFGQTKHGQSDYHLNRILNLALDRQFDRVDPGSYTVNGKPFAPNGSAAQPLAGGIRASDLQHKHFPAVEWVVPHLIAQGLTIVGGRPKAGKSWLMLDTAIAVAEGGYVLGKLCHPGDVAYFALEDTERRLKSRMWKLKGEAPWPAQLSFFLSVERGAEGVKQVRTWLEQAANPRLIIIDTFAKVRAEKRHSENSYDADYAAVGEWKALADEFNVALIFVHHTRKAEAVDPFDTVSGTLGITGAADAIIILHSSSQGRSLLGRGRDVEEFALGVEFQSENCSWLVLGDAADVQRSSQRNSIMNLLRQSGGPMSPKDIAHSLGADDNSVRQLLFKMTADGEVIKEGRGLYSIPLHNIGNKITESLL